MKFICPLITVENIEKSTSFYQNILQQKIKFNFGENVTFHGDFAIHLDSHFKELIDNKEIKQGGNNAELYFEYDEVEKIVTTLKENDVVFVHDVREQPWRQKVVRFYDPDMHIIEVGESMEYLAFRLFKENMSKELIAKTTYMPLDFVNMAIEKYDK